jgi:Ser/Thr protein kinase RdoA (MazF antagonist)
MNDITREDIAQLVGISKLQGYDGTFKELGGGELNDTFALACGNKKVILRISKHANTITLRKEAEALGHLNIVERVPKLVFFDESQSIKGRPWIMESFLEGQHVDRLNINQYRSLGQLLAQIHAVIQPRVVESDFWGDFLKDCSQFANEEALLNHPSTELRELIKRARSYFQGQSGHMHLCLIHGDATPSNVRVNGDEVSLIDWELSRFKDPMADFSTIYYPDMEYNKGRWRVHIKKAEQAALFEGYRQAGGNIDEQRLHVWMDLDKLGAAVYLYWKIHISAHDIEPDQLVQYQLDLDNLVGSLQRNLP